MASIVRRRAVEIGASQQGVRIVAATGKIQRCLRYDLRPPGEIMAVPPRTIRPKILRRKGLGLDPVNSALWRCAINANSDRSRTDWDIPENSLVAVYQVEWGKVLFLVGVEVVYFL